MTPQIKPKPRGYIHGQDHFSARFYGPSKKAAMDGLDCRLTEGGQAKLWVGRLPGRDESHITVMGSSEEAGSRLIFGLVLRKSDLEDLIQRLFDVKEDIVQYPKESSRLKKV